jgi:hypothetical protein
MDSLARGVEVSIVVVVVVALLVWSIVGVIVARRGGK